jgi:hypothetical protein
MRDRGEAGAGYFVSGYILDRQYKPVPGPIVCAMIIRVYTAV